MRPIPALALLAALSASCSSPELAPQRPSWGARIGDPYYPAGPVNKVDVLLVVDNSPSMQDKQALLAESVSYLVERFTAPRCLDPRGIEVARTEPRLCPKGTLQEYQAFADMHVGVITSSLGSHGGDTCSPGPSGNYHDYMEDMAHLIARDAQGMYSPTWSNKGFLVWDPDQRQTPPGEMDAGRFSAQLSQFVLGAGHRGCGFEAPLEAWYRFLVDPEPYGELVAAPCGAQDPGESCRERKGIDETVLRQRADFLRADSMVVIVMLTDESDTSVIDGGRNWRVQTAYDGNEPYHLPRGTSACLTDPMSADCVPCGSTAASQQDPECQKGAYTEEEDPLSLRGYRLRQRFGEDFLYPLRRYAYGLTRTVMRPALVDGDAGPSERDEPGYAPGFQNGDLNPLFCSRYADRREGGGDRTACNTVLRDPRLVLLAGITGVPWQSLANDPTDLKKGYRPTNQLGWRAQEFESFHLPVPPGVTESSSLWDQISGRLIGAETLTDSEGRKSLNPGYLQLDLRYEPHDPLMIESVLPRQGMSPASGGALSPPGAGVTANRVNGHEREIPTSDDLQYACVFPLPEPRECAAGDDTCPCSEPGDNPLCQADDGTYGSVQYRAAAYPGRRILGTLQAVEQLGGSSIAASICPSSLDPAAKDYAYRPAVDAIVERVRPLIGSRCLEPELEADAAGRTDCVLIEARQFPDGASACAPCAESEGRKEPDGEVVEQLKGNGLPCLCEIPQVAEGPALDACISSEDGVPVLDGAPVNGWCYVDLSAHPSSAWMVTGCHRTIRFAGDGWPNPGAKLFLQCRGTTLY